MRCALFAILITGAGSTARISRRRLKQQRRERPCDFAIRRPGPKELQFGSNVAENESFYLTAAHCVGTSKAVDLEWFGAAGGKIPIRTITGVGVKAIWPNEDLALLHAYSDPDPAPVVPIGSEKACGMMINSRF